MRYTAAAFTLAISLSGCGSSPPLSLPSRLDSFTIRVKAQPLTSFAGPDANDARVVALARQLTTGRYFDIPCDAKPADTTAQELELGDGPVHWNLGQSGSGSLTIDGNYAGFAVEIGPPDLTFDFLDAKFSQVHWLGGCSASALDDRIVHLWAELATGEYRELDPVLSHWTLVGRQNGKPFRLSFDQNLTACPHFVGPAIAY